MVKNVQTIEKHLSPLFITGAWRSGTTLISRMINNHPELDVTYDTVHFLRFSFNRYNPISDKKNARALISDTKERLKKRYQLEFSVEELLDDLSGTLDYASLYDSIMRSLLLKKSGKKIWGEKTNLAWSKVPYFLEMFPRGRVIHIIRDPRAVLASWKNFTHAPGNDYLDSILNCYDSMQKALEYEDYYSDSRYTYLTYEELVSKPHETVSKLCQKLAVEYDEKMIDNSKFTDIQGNQWRANTVYQEKINGISTAMIDKWKTKLEDWEIALTEKIMGAMLERFNYRPTDLSNDHSLIEKAIEKVMESKLASEGMIRFLMTGKGVERYPADPCDERNWASTK